MGPARVTVELGEAIQPRSDDWDAALSLRDQARSWILSHCGEPDLGIQTGSLMDQRRNLGL